MEKFLAILTVEDDDWKLLVVVDEAEGSAILIDQGHQLEPKTLVEAQRIHGTTGLQEFGLADEDEYDDFMAEIVQGIWTKT